MELSRRGRSGPVLSSPEPQALAAFPPADIHAPLAPWTDAEMDACLDEWARQGEEHRRLVRSRDWQKVGRNRRICDLFFNGGLSATEIGRLFDLTRGGVYAVIERNRAEYEGRIKQGGPAQPDYMALRDRVLALWDGEGMSETEIMTALAMPRAMVRAIVQERVA